MVMRRAVVQAAAEDRGGVLEIARDAIERIGEQHEHVRKV
jgi:hypothetical protein